MKIKLFATLFVLMFMVGCDDAPKEQPKPQPPQTSDNWLHPKTEEPKPETSTPSTDTSNVSNGTTEAKEDPQTTWKIEAFNGGTKIGTWLTHDRITLNENPCFQEIEHQQEVCLYGAAYTVVTQD